MTPVFQVLKIQTCLVAFITYLLDIVHEFKIGHGRNTNAFQVGIQVSLKSGPDIQRKIVSSSFSIIPSHRVPL
jgi:hypothetical protein